MPRSSHPTPEVPLPHHPQQTRRQTDAPTTRPPANRRDASCTDRDQMIKLNSQCSTIRRLPGCERTPQNQTTWTTTEAAATRLLRKEVIQPHLPVRLPCYDLVLIASPTFDSSLPQGVEPPASGVTDFHDWTGGVYTARERIHRSVADLRLLATPTSWGRVADPNPN